jgi:hypothetical protein
MLIVAKANWLNEIRSTSASGRARRAVMSVSATDPDWWYNVVTALLQRRYRVVTVLLQLLQCWYSVGAVLLQCWNSTTAAD